MRCYVCGRPITSDDRRYNRRVKTGEWIRKNYRTGLAQQRQLHYGVRVVCFRCAQKIDRENRLKELLAHWEIVVVVMVLGIVLILKIFSLLMGM